MDTMLATNTLSIQISLSWVILELGQGIYKIIMKELEKPDSKDMLTKGRRDGERSIGLSG